MSIRLIVVDDHPVVLRGLQTLFGGTEFEIVAEASSAEQAYQLANSVEADVLLLDIRMPDDDGLECLSRLKQETPDLAVLVFSAHANPTYIARVMSIGAAGYLLKGDSRKTLMQSIRRAAAGETIWKREDLRRVTGALATPRLNLDIEAPLTQRESEVLRQMTFGHTNKDIARSLQISYETVKEHVQNILRKIGVSDRTQAAVWAVRQGIV
ncbi:MAG: response regulator transcription factor [Planctomycetota bacterium]|nr:response regulator transcription factor [Planctomycetota bacterium]